MGVALGWKEMAWQSPYIDGRAWNDGVTRSGNRVTFSFNFAQHVRIATGYWNYAWYVDCHCKDIHWTNRKIKDRFTSYNKRIGGEDYWLSSRNGNFKGTVTVGGKDTTIPLQIQFHDDAGNWGNTQTWYVSIPTASSMSNITSKTSNITETSATIAGSITSKGNYSTITKWTITCNGVTKTSTADSTSFSASFTGLNSSTNYNYTIQVWSSSGYTKTTTGSFRTLDDTIGYILRDGQPVKVIGGWVITPDGRQKRITKVRKINPR